MLRPVADVETVSAGTGTGSHGQVVSSAHWGNMLIWREGDVFLEITRKDGTRCHEGQINQIVVEEGELITIG